MVAVTSTLIMCMAGTMINVGPNFVFLKCVKSWSRPTLRYGKDRHIAAFPGVCLGLAQPHKVYTNMAAV